MCFSGRLEIATGCFFPPFQYDSVCSKCYGHHIFPAEAVELVARFFQCGVLPVRLLEICSGFFYHHHTPMCFFSRTYFIHLTYSDSLVMVGFDCFAKFHGGQRKEKV